MGKGHRVRAARADKHRRRNQAALRRAATASGPPGGRHAMESDADLDFPDDLDVTAPNEALFDTTTCPVADTCTGCKARTGLHAVTAAFNRPDGGFDVACTTLCDGCDGRSFLHLLGPTGLADAVTAHATHTSI